MPADSALIPHPATPPIVNDILWISLFCIMAGWLAWGHRNRRELSNTALIFIGAGSMCWQEYYNNWGGYLLYSPDLNLLPWGSSWWTAPNKPVFILFSYAVFFTVIYVLLTALIRWAHRRLPRMPLALLCLLIAAPLFWLYNYVVDKSSVQAGMWTYVHTLGPVVRTGNGGTEPLVWPMLPFALYAAAMAYSLVLVDGAGHPRFLRFGRAERYAVGPRRECARALTAVVWWNAMYWFGFTFWIDLVRSLFLPSNPLVP